MNQAHRPHELPTTWRVVPIAPTHPRFREAERIEFEVFAEMGFTASESGTCEEYEPWRDRSTFYVVVDTAGPAPALHGRVGVGAETQRLRTEP